MTGSIEIPSGPTLRTAATASLLKSVLSHAHGGPPVTRASFGSAAGLSPATVTRAARHLIDLGLVREGSSIPRVGSGRTEKTLEINPTPVVLGVSIGDAPGEQSAGGGWRYSQASSIHCIPVHLDGTYDQSAVADPRPRSDDPERMADALSLVTKDLKLNGMPVLGIGVMVGGHVSRDFVRFSPNLGGAPSADLAGSIYKAVAAEDGGVAVAIDNDANAIARRRLLLGHLPQQAALVLIKDDGIGSALVSKGEVFEGAEGMAGEIGHIPMEPSRRDLGCRCGNFGCLERVATPLAVGQALGLTGTRSQIVAALGKRLRGPDPEDRAHAEAAKAAGYLGRALATLINIVDPGPIIVGLPEALHGVAAYSEAVISAARASVYRSAKIEIYFEPLPGADEAAAAGATKVINRIITDLDEPQD